MKRQLQSAWMTLCLALAVPSFAVDVGGAGNMVGAAPVALITGSDRGLGFALTQELVARGWRVIATCRTPDKATELKAFAAAHSGVMIEKLDVADDAAIDALSAKLRAQPIDALINNAGIVGEIGAQGSGTLDPEEFQRVLRINTYAPLRLARAFLPQISASGQKKIISVSSGIGSLTQAPQVMQYAPAYFYAISKAGLNMEMRMLATELKSRGVLVGLVTPGMVDTAMQTQYRSASAAAGTPITAPVLTPAQSARDLVDYIVGLNAEKSGRVFSHTGAELPW
jgi:NAD(P)-dependent dehydrogenase (short-subunit alcohol dehydrogenase family)